MCAGQTQNSWISDEMFLSPDQINFCSRTFELYGAVIIVKLKIAVSCDLQQEIMVDEAWQFCK